MSKSFSHWMDGTGTGTGSDSNGRRSASTSFFNESEYGTDQSSSQ